MVVIHKFGGGVLRKAEDYGRVASLLEGKGHVAVVSAVYGVTDSLIEATQSSLKSDEHIDAYTQQLLHAHLSILDVLQNTEVRKDAIKRTMQAINRLNKILYGVFLLKELTPRTHDVIQSYGERLSAIALEAHLREKGIEAKAFDADQSGLVTTPVFGNALPLMAKTTENLKKNVLPAAEKGVVVFTGYFGADEKGEITTLGRGGSDFTAGIVANALDAEKVLVWKDVEGFMSADPKVVRGAKLIQLLSYDEAEELGYFGAKILHPKTITPLKEKGIPVYVKNIYAPEKEGTVISAEGKESESVAKSVAIKKDSVLVTIKGGSLLGVSSVAYPVFEHLRAEDLPIDSISTSQSDLSLCFERKYLERFQKALGQASVPMEDVYIEEDVSLLGLIGEGMNHTIGVSGRLFSCLAKAEVNIRMISQGASEINITVAIKRGDVGKALNAVHDEFINGR
ncbi:aspartate kinase [Candidatus Micrarchaeota archaeon]|nr:aspartate kinase [Candidatus Micrarchaeota archaeon]